MKRMKKKQIRYHSVILLAILISSVLPIFISVDIITNNDKEFEAEHSIPKSSDPYSQYIDSITISAGTLGPGTLSNTYTDDGNYIQYNSKWFGNPINMYSIQLRLNFEPPLSGGDYYLSVHITSSYSGQKVYLYVNGEIHDSAKNLDFDDRLINDVTQIRIAGSNDFYSFNFKIFYFKLVPIELPEPVILLGSIQRFFPHENTAKLGYTIYTTSFGTHSPKIDLVVTETATCSYYVNLKVKIDNTLVFVGSRDFYSTEEFFNIDGSLLQSVGTHQILIELTNGDGPNNIYRLEYLKIKNHYFKNSEYYANNRYSPAQIWQYDSQYDNVVVTFGDDVPFLNDDFRTNDVQGIEFWPSITIHMDPDIDVYGYFYDLDCYIHNYKIEWKVIDQEGNYLTSSSAEFNKLNNYGCQIGVSDGNRAENYEAIEFLLRCLETAFIIGTAIYELAPYITIPIDLFLTWLQFGSDPPRSSQNFIDDKTYQVSWTNGIEGFGPWKWPTLKQKSASMLAEWDFEFYDTGQYQIQYHWTLTTCIFRSWKIFPYYQEILPGFTLEGDYFVNFEFY